MTGARRLAAMALGALLVLPSGLLAGPAPQKPAEFRGIPFGAAPADVPGLERTASFGETDFYRRSDEKPVLGEDCPTDIRYGFSRGALFFVRLTLTGCQGLAGLVAAYEAKYGHPVREGAPGIIRLVWRLPTLTVSLSHFARDGDTVVDYVYLPELSRDEREVWQSAEDIRKRGPIGFRGLRFGRERPSVPGLVQAYQEGAAVYYRRQGDNLELGEMRLSDILYGFFGDRFFTVVMRAENAEDFEALRRAYQTKYGPPRTIPGTLEEELVWSWPEAQIALTRDMEAGGVAVRYADAAILAEVAKAEAGSGAPPSLSGGLRIFSKGEPPRSFRGAAFGSAPRSLPTGEYLYTHRGRKYYRRADERLGLGDIPLTSVLYGYDEDRLTGVTLVITPSGDAPQKDYERVLSAYAAKYGPPSDRTGEDGGTVHLWTWPGISIALTRPKVGPMEVHYVDASLLRRREARIAQKALLRLDEKIFADPDSATNRIERPNGEE
ncbi:MAG: hypothetical protein ACP59X_22575 [Solidesulfovibrio sp. DCME]|uniref:hypothetical protein n=1 Tax=Solidesulfovibrio sp. DCME TaxID=3447380 RepID=UPI003D0DE53B